MRKKPAAGKGSGAKKIAPPNCPKCGYGPNIRSGFVQGEQRWKCKSCAYQYTRVMPRGRPLWQKSLAVFLYSYGMSMHNIAAIFHIQPSTVLKWVRQYADHAQRDASESNVYTMDLAEMQKCLKQGNSKSAMLCIAIDDMLFKKSMGIIITPR